MPNLPGSLGGLPTSVLTDGIRRVTVGVDPATFSVEVHVQSADDASAHALAQSLPVLLRSLYQATPWFVDRLPKDIVFAAIDKLPIEVQGKSVILRATGKDIDDAHLRLFGSLVSVFAGSQRKISAAKQLRRIGLAVHNHHSAFRFLPPWQSERGQTDHKNVKRRSNTKLSWRVYLLPFLGQKEGQLFRKFHLDEPWDSPHNKTLLTEMPEIYAGGSPNIPEGHTTVLAPASDGAVLNAKEPTSFADVIDGLSNTVMVVEVSADLAVPWTSPRDYEFDSANPFGKMVVDNGDRCNVLFADGAVRRLRKDLDQSLARALFGRADRIPVRLD